MPATAEILGSLPNLTYVELMDENGESRLTLEDVRILAAAAPHTAFNFNSIVATDTMILVNLFSV